MKPGAIYLVMIFSVCLALGQGKILFTNLGQGLDAPVRNAAGDLVPDEIVPLGGGLCGYCSVSFAAGQSPTNLTPFLTPPFTTVFSQPGYFGVGREELTLDGFEPGSHPWFQVYVQYYVDLCPTTWQKPGEVLEVGASLLFQLDPAGPGLGGGSPAAPAPPLFGMTAFRLSRVGFKSRAWIGLPRSRI